MAAPFQRQRLVASVLEHYREPLFVRMLHCIVHFAGPLRWAFVGQSSRLLAVALCRLPFELRPRPTGLHSRKLNGYRCYNNHRDEWFRCVTGTESLEHHEPLPFTHTSPPRLSLRVLVSAGLYGYTSCSHDILGSYSGQRGRVRVPRSCSDGGCRLSTVTLLLSSVEFRPLQILTDAFFSWLFGGAHSRHRTSVFRIGACFLRGLVPDLVFPDCTSQLYLVLSDFTAGLGDPVPGPI